MKNLKAVFSLTTLIITAVTLITACKSSTNQSNEADSTNHRIKPGKVSKRTQDGCYLYVSGAQSRDTLYVQLHIQNNKVSGRMIEEIYEKDSRKGTIAGTMQADKSIKAIWTFMQEGSTDTMAVAFRLNHTGLLQKPLKADSKTGRQVTDAAAPYSVKLEPTDCNKE
ncbi:hypothetical protein [Mucilaginibacter sp. PAMB04168]|uniref:hypothetical protein n=1 Tax=Mucilaginibacter sp. PAMB04168 TaxID=3138567 RepID=UPI0031F6BEE7